MGSDDLLGARTRRRWKRGRLGLVAIVLGGACLAAVAVGLSVASAQGGGITGTWTTSGNNGWGPQDFVITDSGGSLSGQGVVPGGSAFATLSGSVSGSSVTFTLTYTTDVGYVSTQVGTIGSSGDTMSGTWSSTFNGSTTGQSGDWSATLLVASATEVSCTLDDPDTPTAYFDCTATVGDASGSAIQQVPTGTVTFTVNSGGGGGFENPTCQLQPSQSGQTAFCDEDYTPPPGGIPVGEQPPITATYSGDATFTGSSAQPESAVVTTTSAQTTSTESTSTETSSTETSSTETSSSVTSSSVTSSSETTTTATTSTSPLDECLTAGLVVDARPADATCPTRAQLLQQIQDLQVLRDDLANNKAGSEYAAKVLGGTAGITFWTGPVAAAIAAIATGEAIAADVASEDIERLNGQIQVLQSQLDAMNKAAKPGKLAHERPADLASASRAAPSYAAIATPSTISLVLPPARTRGVRVLDELYRADAQLVSLQRVTLVTLQRAAAAAAAGRASLAKRQWLALATYESDTAKSWTSFEGLQNTFTNLVAGAAHGRGATPSEAKAALHALKLAPASVTTDCRRLGDLDSFLAFRRALEGTNPDGLTGPVAKSLQANEKSWNAVVSAVTADLQNAATLARAQAATFA